MPKAKEDMVGRRGEIFVKNGNHSLGTECMSNNSKACFDTT